MDHLSNELAKTDFKDSFLFYSYKPSAKLVKPVYIPRFFSEDCSHKRISYIHIN